MEAKEKAAQLVVEFIYLLGCDRATGIVAAEKCVDETISALKTVNPNITYPPPIKYWQDIKEEITNL